MKNNLLYIDYKCCHGFRDELEFEFINNLIDFIRIKTWVQVFKVKT